MCANLCRNLFWSFLTHTDIALKLYLADKDCRTGLLPSRGGVAVHENEHIWMSFFLETPPFIRRFFQAAPVAKRQQKCANEDPLQFPRWYQCSFTNNSRNRYAYHSRHRFSYRYCLNRIRWVKFKQSINNASSFMRWLSLNWADAEATDRSTLPNGLRRFHQIRRRLSVCYVRLAFGVLGIIGLLWHHRIDLSAPTTDGMETLTGGVRWLNIWRQWANVITILHLREGYLFTILRNLQFVKIQSRYYYIYFSNFYI